MPFVKLHSEIRDPIHEFIRCNNEERKVIDSRFVQRLRNIHQLALSYLVYPGATHKRFEHSLGVMELAGRVFDVVTDDDNVHHVIRDQMPEIRNAETRPYWRNVVRIAALCHDIGHLPFSHAAEHDLLPDGWNHERLTVEIIRSEEFKSMLNSLTPPIRSSDVEKIAVGQKELPDALFSDWEAILSEIVVGDAFGVDRMDYLLRDSIHCGVAYGRFDHYRLVDTLRVLPSAAGGENGSNEPELGVEGGGLQSAEGLLLARYSMFSQVYLHPVRRAFDIHLQDFLKDWLPEGKFPTVVERHLASTDIEVISAMTDAAKSSELAGHHHARRIVERDHFRLLWKSNPSDITVNPAAGDAIYEAVANEFGVESVRRDTYLKTGVISDFPVLERDGRIQSALALSPVLQSIPPADANFVFVDPELRESAEGWIAANRATILENFSDSSAGEVK